MDLLHSVDDSGLLLLQKEPKLFPHLRSFPLTLFDDESLPIPTFASLVLDHERSWTANLEEITNFRPSPTFAKLPKSLTSYITWYREVLLPDTIDALPRGLTRLHLIEMVWKDLKVSYWPSTLSDLQLDNGTSFGPHCFHMLPRGLKTLAITEFLDTSGGEGDHGEMEEDEKVASDFDALCTLGRASLAGDSNWTSTKQHLLTLRNRASSATSESLEAYIKSIESGRLFGLPLTLANLDLAPMLKPLNVKLLLPPHIERVIHCSEHVNPLYLFGAFSPTSAAHLSVKLQGYVSDSLASIAARL